MQEINVVSLLTKFSADVVVGAVVACVCALFLKMFFKNSFKFYMLVSFACALAVTFLLNFFALGREVVESLNGGITAGALSIILTVFIKKFAFTDDEELKKNLEKLLSTIVLSDNLDEVVDDLLKRITESKTVKKAEIKSVLKDCLEDGVDDPTLDILTDFLCNALNIGEKKDEN